MNKPILLVMAAGMGSRFGGLKQMVPIGKNRETILEFSIHDAICAGFGKVVFIIKPEMEIDFRRLIGKKAEERIQVEYAFQELSKIPKGFKIPEERIKPWGTGHAVLCAKEYVDRPFAVINADDFYGREAFNLLSHFLKNQKDDNLYRFCMISFLLENTLTENGHVARGICQIEDSFLKNITERTHIEKREGRIQYTEDGGESWKTLPPDTPVSMNLWGFSPAFMNELEAGFPQKLREILSQNPIKGEYFLPSLVNDLLRDGRATVKVISSPSKWYGVTYKEDLPNVTAALQDLQNRGFY
ncbi:MAG: nucleotidyltransferase family protein [Anaerovoracaceae bacterium]|jgi:dTDP-glucose pyrophosphorylase